ncbi:MAG TPA: O-antigen ligase family protein [Solirubrobacterales bacterium]|nr:O-antigen ligase family protein [Solirubrobacterales bacterium]
MDARLGRLLSAPATGDLRLGAAPRRVLLALAGLGCGLSPAFYGYFDLSVWGPLGLALVVAAVALLFAHPAVPTGIRAAAVVGLLAFGAWCLLSIGWAESGDRALVEGDRWMVYGLYLLVLVLLVADRADAEVLLAATAAGVIGIAGYDAVRLLGSDNRALFSGTRLVEPLGYVNGLGGFFLLGFWPLIAVAERIRQPLLAGLAAAGAALLAALVVLTDSRGTLFAFALSGLLLLVLLPGRNRRAWVLLFVLAGVAAAWGPLTDVTQALPSPIANPPSATIERGMRSALLAAACVGVLWALATWALELVRAREPALGGRLARASAAVLGAFVVAALLLAAATVSDPVGRVSDQYEAFTELEPTVNGASRFTSGGGNRYDYWRIAWHQFTDNPLDGLGAGNYDRTYFLERQTDEDVRQAHSIELQTLGETGLVGALLLGSFLLAVFLGAWRWAGVARRAPAEIGVAVAALGTFAVWLGQTSVDWLHLIPGVTGIALAAAAVLLRRRPGEGGSGAGLRPLPALGLAAAVLLAAAAVFFVGRPTLAEHLRSNARGQLDSNPAAALASADESLSLNADSLQGYYLKAAAFARLGDYRRAKGALLEATRREPHNYVTWGLLGDLLTRRGAIDAAQRAYRRASILNPRDRGLRLLAARPRLVERLHRHPERAAAVIEAAS